MKPIIFRTVSVLSMLLLSLAIINCSSSSTSVTDDTTDDTSDSDTTTTTIDAENVAVHVEAAASALLPDITTSDEPSLVKAVTYGDSTAWDTYTSEINSVYLEDIFGNNESGPVTQVRVLISQFAGDVLEYIFSTDPDADCTDATALTSDSDTIDITFYGAIDNGTSDNRFFRCYVGGETGGVVYGVDNDGVIHVAYAETDNSENDELPEVRGDRVAIMQVVMAQYAETTEDDVSVAYLDLQYTHATIYNGTDGDFDADDDNMEFKSRSRITGRITLDSDGNPEDATGDFQVTKYDSSQNESLERYTNVTKTIGRGSYGSGDASLFKIDSDSFPEIPGTFCLQTPSEGTSTIPEFAESTECTALEVNFAWGDATFPFDLSPALDADFDDKEFFEDDAETLIASDGSNFTIETYE